MSMDKHEDEPSAASTKSLEIATALFFLLIGGLVMWDSYRIGAKWGDDGPQSGYFPFYIGLLMCIATLANLLTAIRVRRKTSFVSQEKLKLVLAIFLPCLVYLVVMQFVGLYVSSAIFIAIFMRWQGKFSWVKSILTGLGTSIILFAMFEIWFKVPLFKGPLEAAFGY
ncbi:MAG TPA: tripartite tricarboxylate transporter TctB family protein [Burkholderiaceae bacterium]|nr:tripartite tricarboxylate transporter TctB family protein [Burkholderiaceae bacterium]